MGQDGIKVQIADGQELVSPGRSREIEVKIARSRVSHGIIHFTLGRLRRGIGNNGFGLSSLSFGTSLNFKWSSNIWEKGVFYMGYNKDLR